MEIVLESNCGIAQAEALSRQLEDIFQKSTAVIINGSAITRIDTSVLQLLYSFFSAMKETGISVSWKEPSEVLCSAADMLGLKTQLML